MSNKERKFGNPRSECMDALKARLSQAEDDRDTLAVLVKDLSNILTQDGWKLDIKDEYAAALARAKEQP